MSRERVSLTTHTAGDGVCVFLACYALTECGIMRREKPNLAKGELTWSDTGVRHYSF
jgi:hypothetical protein